MQYLSKIIAYRRGPERAALGVLAHLYSTRFNGITLGAVEDGDAALTADLSFSLGTDGSAPEETTAVADDVGRVTGLRARRDGLWRRHLPHVQRLAPGGRPSTEGEAMATGKAGEIVSYGREIMRALGVKIAGRSTVHAPTLVGTDNKANLALSRARARRRGCARHPPFHGVQAARGLR